ncbi:autophagy-related protein 18b isoform X2 [Oryza brachyantha]|uniref:autophagy-related protein 18b isoform X2 n=1 Tax=Oryza brachyantha TaxID=4533 RepID=UPI00077651F2|nr:autophagy-related protein 18b isoform X2 [Oryza brachyantha]
MASSSSPPQQILCASFNQDNSMFYVGTKDGFRIFDAHNGRLCYEKNIGGIGNMEMYFGSNLLAIVGTGEQPVLSPRRLCLFDTKIGATKKDLNFKTSVLAVRLSRKRLVVVLQDRTFIYDLNSTTILEEIETVPNTKGLCAFAPKSEACYLAIPASTSKGSALVYKASEPELICQIDAHQSALAAMAFSSNGTYLATASEKGTIIRVYLVAQATKSHSFRRGTYPSTIYSLSFGPSNDLPDVLVATSSSGSLHMFFLDGARNRRNQTNRLLGSIIPGAITDALDPANHHIIHNVIPAEIKRTVVYIISHDGYFREYTINTKKSNESSWVLQREFSLLGTGNSTPQQDEQQMD